MLVGCWLLVAGSCWLLFPPSLCGVLGSTTAANMSENGMQKTIPTCALPKICQVGSPNKLGLDELMALSTMGSGDSPGVFWDLK